MKRLTQEEFYDRMNAIQRARKIFCETGLTSNLTHAFEVYQELLAEQERDIIVHAAKLPEDMGGFVLTEEDKLDCPGCGTKMYLRFFKNPAPGEAVSQLVCQNPKCDTIYDSNKTASEWINILRMKRKERADGKV